MTQLSNPATSSTIQFSTEFENFDTFDPVQSNFDVDLYPGNQITFENGVMRVNASDLSYAHIEKNFTGGFPILETHVNYISGTTGAYWCPGIGMWWNAENSFSFCINFVNPTLRYLHFTYMLNNEDGTVGQGFPDTTFTSIGLKVDLTALGKIGLYYTLDNVTWNIVNPNAYNYGGQDPDTLNFPLDWYGPGLFMLGKGVPNNFATAISDGPEFDTYLGNTLNFGVTEFEYYNFTSTSFPSITETQTTTLSNTITESNTETETETETQSTTITESNTETETETETQSTTITESNTETEIETETETQSATVTDISTVTETVNRNGKQESTTISSTSDKTKSSRVNISLMFPISSLLIVILLRKVSQQF